MRTVRHRRGVRLVHGDVVVSDLLRRPGPTHGIFDVLAACVSVLAPGPRFLMLGFAAGGLVAPLRALGWSGAVEAVDLSREGEPLFRRLSRGWAGRVDLRRDDAVRRLRHARRRYDLILDDLSEARRGGVTKPEACATSLPRLMSRRTSRGGVAVSNLLPMPGWTWKRLLGEVSGPWPRALVVLSTEYENRLVVGGAELPTAAALSRELRAALRRLGSRQAAKVSVRTLRS